MNSIVIFLKKNYLPNQNSYKDIMYYLDILSS